MACEWWGDYESTGWGSGGRTEPNTGQVRGGGTGRRDDEALVRRLRGIVRSTSCHFSAVSWSVTTCSLVRT